MVAMRMPLEEAQAFVKEHPGAKIYQPKKRLEQKQATLDAVLDFCRERNSPVDGARFFKYYDGRGWVDGAGNKITDWREKLIEWEGNGMNKSKTGGQVQAQQNIPVKSREESIKEFIDFANSFKEKHRVPEEKTKETEHKSYEQQIANLLPCPWKSGNQEEQPADGEEPEDGTVVPGSV